MNFVTALAHAREAVTAALADGTAPEGQPAALLREHGTMKLYFYEPRGRDGQAPHEQDEIYVVASGSGTFVIGQNEGSLEAFPFQPGDAIFTPAGAIHRFEDFTEDLGVWVVFWGPKGGEEADAHPQNPEHAA